MKTQKGITLIALIITIIVMLILVGVSVTVALNTGLFKTAQGVAKNTEAERINETELSGGQITIEGQGTKDINSYVNSLTKDPTEGGNGGNKEYIPTTGDPYIGCYAYVDGTIGIIYADFAHPSEEGSNWMGSSYSYAAGTGFKNYYVDGTYEEGPFPPGDILVAEGDGNERFLIMALEDMDTETYSWYNTGDTEEDGIEVITETGIGLNEDGIEIGKANTEKMLAKWKGDTDIEKSNNDIWWQIEANSSWFIPSKDEWLAFADLIDPTYDFVTYEISHGLYRAYWSSSQFDAINTYYISFDGVGVSGFLNCISDNCRVRLSATF